MLVVVPGSLTQLREGWARVPGHTPVPKGNGTGACARLTRRQTVPVPTSRVVLRFISSGPFPVQKSPLPYSEAYVWGEHWGISLLWRGKQAILADTSRSRSTPYVGKAIAGLLLSFQMGLVRGVANPHGGLTKLCLFLHCTLEFWVPAGFNARDWSAHSKIR